MKSYENNAYFWQKIDTLYLSSSFVLLREKNDVHPKYPSLVYPVDYGHLSDVNGVNVYRGSQKPASVNALIVAADILKKEIDIKLLAGCSEKEESEIMQFLNQSDLQKTVLIRRGNDIPNWGITD